jgi:hypothetical protein
VGGGASILRMLACVLAVALSLPLLGCTVINLITPTGQSVQAFVDLDPYQRRYYYYYDDPRTGQRKRVPSEWLNKQDEYRQAARSGSDLFSGVARGELVFDTTDGTTDPGPGTWVRHGSVPDQELKKRKLDANVTLDEKRSGNDGNGGRDR